MHKLATWMGAGLAALLLGAMADTAAAQSGPPPPDTLSAEGRAALAASARAPQPPADIPGRRAFLSKFQGEFGAEQQRRYAVDIVSSTLAGVPVRLIRARDTAPGERRILLNLHGGGFNADSGSLTENIPVAALTRIPVVAVLYRLAPEHIYPDAVDDALAVYRGLLKTHTPSEIGVYGTSAGAILGPELIARIRKEGLPEPAALGMFSGDADLSAKGDSIGAIDIAPLYRAYLGRTPPTDSLASPARRAVNFFPPTLCLTSSRDSYLSATANFCRKLELAGVENTLVVFDGLPHAFWSYLAMPESDQAFAIMARFLSSHLEK